MARSVSFLVLSLALGPDLRAGWDPGALADLEAQARRRPFGVLRLEPGERLRYRVRTVAVPPRIPFLSTGRAVTVESFPEFLVRGLDPAGYRIGLRVRTVASDPAATQVRATGSTGFVLDTQGRPSPGPGPDDEAALANAMQLFRDLSGLADPSRAWSEERWSYFHASRMGIPRIRTVCRYEPEGVDPATGNLRATIEVRETPDERSRGRGYHTRGRIELDPRGRLVRIETRGKLWKKALFLTLAVTSSYQAELLGDDEPAAADFPP